MLALVLAALGMAMLVNVLLVSLRSRRGDLAILKLELKGIPDPIEVFALSWS